jgi:hypothetical protein
VSHGGDLRAEPLIMLAYWLNLFAFGIAVTYWPDFSRWYSGG